MQKGSCRAKNTRYYTSLNEPKIQNKILSKTGQFDLILFALDNYKIIPGDVFLV